MLHFWSKVAHLNFQNFLQELFEKKHYCKLNEAVITIFSDFVPQIAPGVEKFKPAVGPRDEF